MHIYGAFLSYFHKEYDVNFYSDEGSKDETTTLVFVNPSKAICRHQNDVNQCWCKLSDYTDIQNYGNTLQ